MDKLFKNLMISIFKVKKANTLLIYGLTALIFTTSPLASTTPTPKQNIYQYTNSNMFSPIVKNALSRVYVPNSKSGTVSVIDPNTYQVIDTFATGNNPQHVVPAYDLQTLWVLNNKDNTATPINPTTGKPGAKITMIDPYNLYFTPDGKFAIVVCEARKQLQFLDPKTMRIRAILPTQCGGANHMDFTADGQFAIVTCEFSAKLMKIDVKNIKVISYLTLAKEEPKQVRIAATTVRPRNTTTIKLPQNFTINADGKFLTDASNPMRMTITTTKTVMQKSMPQDIRSTADGSIFLVADMMQDGVLLIDPVSFKKIGFIATGVGTHAIYPSRDGKLFYISNRGCRSMNCGTHGPGSISVVDPAKRKAIANWAIPNGGSPDMGNISADGKELWLSGRYDGEVYVFDTTTGTLTHRIPVGKSPHGMTFWPQPGRYSLGHTGNMR